MTTSETRDPQWDDQRDGAFFRIVSDLFPPAMLLAATVLLASYDETSEAEQFLPNTPRQAAPGVTLAR